MRRPHQHRRIVPVPVQVAEAHAPHGAALVLVAEDEDPVGPVVQVVHEHFGRRQQWVLKGDQVRCFPELNIDGMKFGGVGYRGGNADKTPYTLFWYEGLWRMKSVPRENVHEYAVGDLLRIRCEPVDVAVSSSTTDRVFIEWPWRVIDQASDVSWDGTIGFSRYSDDSEWSNTPWRFEPDTAELRAGGAAMMGIPPTEVRVTAVVEYDGPADFGWSPRPTWALGVCAVEDLGDEEAGYVLHLDAGEPIEVERIEPLREPVRDD
ncbi:hypothetical protein [Streptomyces sp. VRA16 Mangrove soil]|uniref:hypothetical protein n=1 Tax=Streptomyces sp. VRA16 Mangrove soil TaxID=2817434 RepID=UPI001A9EFFE8|nr:hypothetical protein [Streptomyces sp. VRA16 Mangrove soil]MBO1336304.1 hypothetical protein [Streptomyces sp. VRA16 Mangrove soil]